MRFDARLQSFGHYGVPTPLPFPFSVIGEDQVARAVKRGAFRGLKYLGELPKGNKRTGRAGSDNPSRVAGTCLAFTLYADPAYLTKTAWGDLVGTQQYLYNPTSPFRGNIPGLYHAQSVLNMSSAYRGLNIGRNEPWWIRLYLFKPPKDQTRHLFQQRWGTAESGVYQFEIADGQSSIMRLSPQWSQSQEDRLNALLAQQASGLGANSTANQAETLTIRASIYRDYQSAGHPPGGSWYNNPLTLIFIPEPLGRLNIIYGEGRDAPLDTYDHTAIQATRQAGTLWGNTQLTLRANAGSYIWQPGCLNHFNPGELGCGPFGGIGSDTLLTGGLYDTSNAGTSVNVIKRASANDDGSPGDGSRQDVVFQLNTSNPRISPFFYSGYGIRQAGERNGSMVETFDSDEHRNAAGDAPFQDVSVQFEGDAATCGMRRKQWVVKTSDINGQVFAGLPTSFNYETLEHRMVDLQLGPVGGDLQYVARNSIVMSCGPTDMAKATPNLLRAAVMKGTSQNDLVICNQWAIAEEDLIEEDPMPTPGMRLGGFLRIVLRGMGVRDSEMTSVGIYDGPVLPQAALGEAPPIRAQWQAVRADFLRDLVIQYGRGWLLTIDDSTGGWTFAPKPSSLKQIVFNGNTYDVEFYSTGTDYLATSYPGRFVVLKMLNASRGVDNFYNAYRATGGRDAQDGTISSSWTIQNSITIVTTPVSKKHIGRIKRCPDLTSDGFRTQGDADLAVRNQADLYGVPPRWWEFETYFNEQYEPGMICSLDTIPTRCETVAGSSKADTMQLRLRETE